MPKLPELTNERRPAPSVVGGVISYRPTSGAETVAAEAVSQAGLALARAGEQIGLAGDEIYRRVQVEEERINTLRAEDAFNRLRERTLDLELGKENGYSNIKGGAAVGRPLAKEWLQKFDQESLAIEKTLANDEQKDLYRRRAAVGRLAYGEGLVKHQAAQSDAFERDNYLATVAVEVQRAAAHYDSATDVGISMERIRAAVRQRAEHMGWSEDVATGVLQEEMAKIHSTVIGQAIANGNHIYAQQWYEAHKGEVSTGVAEELARAVERGTQKEITDAYMHEFVGMHDSIPGLEALGKRILADDKLDLDRKNALFLQVKGRGDTLENKALIQQARRDSLIEKTIDAFNANTFAGMPPSDPNTIAELYALTKDTPYHELAEQAVATAQGTMDFSNAHPVQQERVLADLEKKVSEDPNEHGRDLLSTFRTIYEGQRKHIDNDPYGFLLKRGLVEDMPVDMEGLLNPKAEAMDPSGLQGRYNALEAAASTHGAPYKPLRPEELGIMTDVLGRMGAEGKTIAFKKLWTASRGNDDGYLAIMSQIAEDDPISAWAGANAQHKPGVARLVLQGVDILKPPGDESGSTRQKPLLPMPSDASLQLAFQEYAGGVFDRRPELRGSYYLATVAAYAGLSSQAGGEVLNPDDPHAPIEDRFKKAVEGVVGRVEEYNDTKTIIPDGMDLDEFEDALHDRLQDIVSAKTLDPFWTMDRMDDMPVMKDAEGRYFIPYGDGYVIDKHGNKVVIDFNRPSLSPKKTKPLQKGGPVR